TGTSVEKNGNNGGTNRQKGNYNRRGGKLHIIGRIPTRSVSEGCDVFRCGMRNPSLTRRVCVAQLNLSRQCVKIWPLAKLTFNRGETSCADLSCSWESLFCSAWVVRP